MHLRTLTLALQGQTSQRRVGELHGRLGAIDQSPGEIHGRGEGKEWRDRKKPPL